MTFSSKQQSVKKPFLFVCLFFIHATVLFAGPPPIAVVGTVQDEQGQPVSDAVVQHYDLSKDAVRSDEQGRFTIPVDEVDAWTFIWAFSPDGKQLGKSRIALEEGNPKIPEIIIKLTSSARRITGRVLDFEGRPVKDAIVGGEGWGWFPILTTTDVDGQFAFSWKKDEPLLQVFAIKPDVGFHFIGTEEIRLDRGQTPPDKISDGSFEIRLKKPHRVEVLVTDFDDKPLSGCDVFATGFRKQENDENPLSENERRFYPSAIRNYFDMVSDEKGYARFDWIPEEGFSRMEFFALGPDSGIPAANGTKAFYGNGEKNYSFKSKEPPVIPLPKQARIEGKIVYSDGSPASWSRVSIRYENGHTIRFADANGIFKLSDNVGTWGHIGIESDRETLPGLFWYDFGDGTEIKRPEFKLRKGVKVQGIVFDEEKNPCSKQFGLLFDEHSPDPTRPDDRVTRQAGPDEIPIPPGLYQCVLPPGIYDVSAWCDDLGSEPRMLEIKENDEEIWFDFQLKKRDE